MNLNISRSDLLSLEQYSEQRAHFKAQGRKAREQRKLFVNEHLMFQFENKFTTCYQIQEILLAERIFKAEDIEGEIAAYEPLLSTPQNLTATLMIQFADSDERRAKLQELRNIEDHISLHLEGAPSIHGIANEDMERSNEEKTSAVHFFRFPLQEEHLRSLVERREAIMQVAHPNLQCSAKFPSALLTALAEDLGSFD